jgi:hypothetical protein
MEAEMRARFSKARVATINKTNKGHHTYSYLRHGKRTWQRLKYRLNIWYAIHAISQRGTCGIQTIFRCYCQVIVFFVL